MKKNILATFACLFLAVSGAQAERHPLEARLETLKCGEFLAADREMEKVYIMMYAAFLTGMERSAQESGVKGFVIDQGKASFAVKMFCEKTPKANVQDAYTMYGVTILQQALHKSAFGK